MLCNIECIALRTTKVSDSKNLLSAWSRSHGRITLSIPAGTSKDARRRRALSSPLQIFEGVADIRPDRDIYNIRDMRAGATSLVLDPSPQKSLISIFLSEVLDILLRRAEPDSLLSDFLFGSIEALTALDSPLATASFHIIFLYRLSHFLGIEPRLDTEGEYFDLREARFRPTLPLHHHYLNPDESAVLRAISHANYRTAAFISLDRTARNIVLDKILQYYSIHLQSMSGIKSIEILRSLID